MNLRSLILLGGGLAWMLVSGCGQPEQDQPVPVETPPPAIQLPSAGRPASQPDSAWLSTARQLLGSRLQETSCGPYRLLSDTSDPVLLSACRTIGRQLDLVYQGRYGVRPLGEPREAVILFERLADFQQFARQRAGTRNAYAGFSNGARGAVVLYSEKLPRATVIQTMAHEMTHLVNRRALGTDLPRWLSEGLADGIGDAATSSGLEAVRGLEGVKVQANRLRWAMDAGKVPQLKEFLQAGDHQFDRGSTAVDYELAALFIRHLLLDAELAQRLQAYLTRLVQDEEYNAEALRQELGKSWQTLEGDFRLWLRRSTSEP